MIELREAIDCRDLLSVVVTKYKDRRGAHRRLLFLASCKLSAKLFAENDYAGRCDCAITRWAERPVPSSGAPQYEGLDSRRRPWRYETYCTRHYRFPAIGPAEPILATMASPLASVTHIPTSRHGDLKAIAIGPVLATKVAGVPHGGGWDEFFGPSRISSIVGGSIVNR